MKVKPNTAEFLVKGLEAEGVRYVFGVPGEENLLFLEAIRESSLEFIVTRHEQAAVFMAATVGRFTGKIGVALSTLGPGASNLTTGMAYATLGGFPVLAITGQKPIRKSKQGKFQIIPVVKMMEPVTKFSSVISSGKELPALFQKAVTIAVSEREGAVHLELPEDVAEDLISSEAKSPVCKTPPLISSQVILKAVAILNSARNPLIILGRGANQLGVSTALFAFINKTKIPFAVSQMAKGVLDERLPEYIGTTALSAGDYVHKAVERADVVIVIGHDTTEKPPAILSCGEQKIIHIHSSPAGKDRVYVPCIEVVGDIASALAVLVKKAEPKTPWDFSCFYRVRAAFQKSIQEKSSVEHFPIKPERIVADIRKSMPEDGILSLDNGMYKIFIARNYPAYKPNTVLLDNALATMGAGLPVGIATKLLYPKRKVLVVVGDGGFMMNAGELETAKRLGLDLVVLILNDSGFGMISWKQKEMGFPDFGLTFGNPDFVALAKSFGVSGHRISKTAELLPTLKKVLNAKGIHVIDCPIDYSDVNDALGKGLVEEIKRL